MRFLFLPASLVALALLCACSKKPDPEYLAHCEGPPLKSVEKREQAQQDGYEVLRRYDCISKTSYAAVQQQKAEWEAANTPEAKAAREAERTRVMAESGAAASVQPTGVPEALPPPMVIRLVDVNTASEDEMAALPGISKEGAAAIVAERSRQKFTGWEDVVARVVQLSQAQSVVYASISGLTVNGQSFPDAPPDGQMAAMLAKKFEKSTK